MKNTTLTENINNNFYLQRNALTGRMGEITALVEDYADTYLWLVILQTACPNRQFRLMPYQEGENLSQSKNLIAREIMARGGNLYIGCIDSDQSYLLRRYGNQLGKAIEQTKFLFHTYAYSMENLICMPSTLSQIVTASTSLQSSFSFDEFFKAFSNTIYNLFLLDLFLRSKQSKTVLSVDKWKNIYPGEKVIKKSIKDNRPVDLINDVAKKVKTFEKKLYGAPEFSGTELKAFEQSLLASNDFLNKDNCCLFVYGHELLEFVSMLLVSVADVVVSSEKARINGQTKMNQDVKKEKLSHLDNQQKDITSDLRSNMGFVVQNSLIFNKIKTDLSVL